MEHPILFISLILEALGLPVPHTTGWSYPPGKDL